MQPAPAPNVKPEFNSPQPTKKRQKSSPAAKIVKEEAPESPRSALLRAAQERIDPSRRRWKVILNRASSAAEDDFAAYSNAFGGPALDVPTSARMSESPSSAEAGVVTPWTPCAQKSESPSSAEAGDTPLGDALGKIMETAVDDPYFFEATTAAAAEGPAPAAEEGPAPAADERPAAAADEGPGATAEKEAAAAAEEEVASEEAEEEEREAATEAEVADAATVAGAAKEGKSKKKKRKKSQETGGKKKKLKRMKIQQNAKESENEGEGEEATDQSEEREPLGGGRRQRRHESIRNDKSAALMRFRRQVQLLKNNKKPRGGSYEEGNANAIPQQFHEVATGGGSSKLFSRLWTAGGKWKALMSREDVRADQTEMTQDREWLFDFEMYQKYGSNKNRENDDESIAPLGPHKISPGHAPPRKLEWSEELKAMARACEGRPARSTIAEFENDHLEISTRARTCSS